MGDWFRVPSLNKVPCQIQVESQTLIKGYLQEDCREYFLTNSLIKRPVLWFNHLPLDPIAIFGSAWRYLHISTWSESHSPVPGLLSSVLTLSIAGMERLGRKEDQGDPESFQYHKSSSNISKNYCSPSHMPSGSFPLSPCCPMLNVTILLHPKMQLQSNHSLHFHHQPQDPCHLHSSHHSLLTSHQSCCLYMFLPLYKSTFPLQGLGDTFQICIKLFCSSA